MAADFVIPTLVELGMLLCIGIFALGGQLALTYAYALADASEVSIFNYSGILFSMVFGWFFLGQPISPSCILGAAMVISAGFIVFASQKKCPHDYAQNLK